MNSTEADSKPVVYKEELIAEAKGALGSIQALLAPAPSMIVRRWLINLGESVRSTYDKEEADRVTKQLVDDLVFPTFCYSQETCRQAAIQFKWFPKLQELNEFFNEVCAEEWAFNHALKAIAEAPPTDEHGLSLEISKLKKHGWRLSRHMP